MQRIHRRRNDEIEKAFACPQKCGKAYGSYAALYTHIKSKHPDTKPPEMKTAPHNPIKKQSQIITKPPKDAYRQGFRQYEQELKYDCNICKKDPCHCYEQIDEDDLERTIMILEDAGFIRFVDNVSKLNVGDTVAWVRSTEDPFSFLNKAQIKQLNATFNKKYRNQENAQFVLNAKWVQYLSFSSKFWVPQNLTELYMTILLLLSHPQKKEAQKLMKKDKDFQNMVLCMTQKPTEWTQFVELVQMI